ncbi:MAG: VWA domain-containing protein [Desulfuromonadaceae bacterium]|nr:VWA domain-containing protein [Desulfuromonadaceae bacterium]
MAAFLFVVLALCRPELGTESESVESMGIDIIVALDTSRSMLADDLLPTRLDAAKREIVELVSRLHGDRIGLVAFAGSAFPVCPLTLDYDAFIQVLTESGSNTIPRGGTDFSALTKEVVNAFAGTEPRSRLLLLVSDGEDHGSFDSNSPGQLLESGITICSVTAGSEAGGIIPLHDGDFLKDKSGNIVQSRANPSILNSFSNRNIMLGSDVGKVAGLYDEVRPLMQQRSIKNRQQRYKEYFQLPLAAALLLLVAEAFLACRIRA